MTKHYCDRCGVELPYGQQSGHVTGVEDADDGGSGKVTEDAELCRRCYREFKLWLRGPAGPAKRRVRNGSPTTAKKE